MSGKRVINTSSHWTTKTHKDADGTIVEVTTTTTTEKYSDGTSGVKTNTKTVRKQPKTYPPKTANTTDQRFIQECLQAHNRLRAKHGAAPLVLDAELCQVAQAWANNIAGRNIMEHNSNRGGAGENIYWSTAQPSGSQPVQSFYDEIKDFNFNKMGFSMATGHFTQVVWKSTKLLGVAMQRGNNGYYVVANYYPPGNMEGDFEANIQR